MTVKAAMNRLRKALTDEDSDYWIGWKANIAMAFQDEAYRQNSRDSSKKLRSISNAAADHFLALLTQE